MPGRGPRSAFEPIASEPIAERPIASEPIAERPIASEPIAERREHGGAVPVIVSAPLPGGAGSAEQRSPQMSSVSQPNWTEMLAAPASRRTSCAISQLAGQRFTSVGLVSSS